MEKKNTNHLETLTMFMGYTLNIIGAAYGIYLIFTL